MGHQAKKMWGDDDLHKAADPTNQPKNSMFPHPWTTRDDTWTSNPQGNSEMDKIYIFSFTLKRKYAFFV